MRSPIDDDSPTPGAETQTGRQPQDETSGAGESPGFAERITGSRDPQDPDGLITLDDLPDRTADASDLSDLTARSTQYGDGPES